MEPGSGHSLNAQLHASARCNARDQLAVRLVRLAHCLGHCYNRMHQLPLFTALCEEISCHRLRVQVHAGLIVSVCAAGKLGSWLLASAALTVAGMH